MRKIQTSSYFDGQSLHLDGPFVLEIDSGAYQSIRPGSDPEAERADFLMPSLVESHAHLFLDGDELDAPKRGEHLKRPREELLECGRRNLWRYRSLGVRTLRDAGDAHGVNLELRSEAEAAGMKLLAAASGLRKAKRYGSFMAREVESFASLEDAVRETAKNADAIKIILTGIIDFENGVVKGEPQFDHDETKLIVETAHSLGLKTFAHCSGVAGLEVAARAGVDSIEHGFFMDLPTLELMAQKGIAWTPTLLPVHFQWSRPECCGWSPAAVDKLRGILDNHCERLLQAERLGVPLLAGSDAGSYGVKHGFGLFEEMALLRQAGLAEETVLRSVTSEPRRQLGLPPVPVAVGARADFLLTSRVYRAKPEMPFTVAI